MPASCGDKAYSLAQCVSILKLQHLCPAAMPPVPAHLQVLAGGIEAQHRQDAQAHRALHACRLQLPQQAPDGRRGPRHGKVRVQRHDHALLALLPQGLLAPCRYREGLLNMS